MLITAMTATLAAGCGKSSDGQERRQEGIRKTGEDYCVRAGSAEYCGRRSTWRRQKGILKKRGLDGYHDSPGAICLPPLFTADEAQFGLYGPEMICKFVEEGQDTELIYTCTDTYPYSFFLSKDVKIRGGFKRHYDQWRRQRLLATRFVRSIINNAGLDADNDVTYANMKNSAVIAALDSGEVKRPHTHLRN